MYLCTKDERSRTATFAHIPTFPPFANIASACALPIPLAAPVITATLPSIFISVAGACATIAAVASSAADDTAAAAAAVTTRAVVAPTAADDTDAAAVTTATGTDVTNAEIIGAAASAKATVATATPGTEGTVMDGRDCVLIYVIPGCPEYICWLSDRRKIADQN